MSELKLTGTIKTILPVQSGTAKSGNDWQDKYFTGLQAWKIEKVGATTEAPKQELDKGDDLPF